MKAQFIFLVFLLSYVVATTEYFWNQPPLEQSQTSPDTMLYERAVAMGVAAPRTFSAPSKNGFNFDSFAADDFFVNSFTHINGIWIAIAVNNLESYDIDSVYIAIYKDADGLPAYDPYSPDSPAPLWSRSYDWVSNDPDADFGAPWHMNPVRHGAISVDADADLLPGVYWLTMHFEISSSDVSIPPAMWLPGKTQGDTGSPARLYVPGDNPSAGSSNAFGWFWNTLRRSGLGDLSFKLEADTANFTIETNSLDGMTYVVCSGDTSLLVNVSIDYFFPWNESVILNVEFPIGSPLSFSWVENETLTVAEPSTAFEITGFTPGNTYSFFLNFTSDDMTSTYWLQEFTIQAVDDELEAPEWIVRDEYGLIGGLFQWRANGVAENFDIEIDEDDGDFSDPELSQTIPGTLTSYRPTLADFVEDGNISMFGVREQAFYNARIRAVNPGCNATSDWVTLRFQSDECELMSATFENGTYNFKKGKFVRSSTLLTDYGTIMDIRVRIRGFHQRWSDVGLALRTPVMKEGFPVDIPLFAEDCHTSWDTHNPNSGADHFEIYFVIGGNSDSLCPRPPLEGEPANSTHVEPWGVNVFRSFVLGQDKRGTWALEWIDYGIGFPTNGKISDYDVQLCSIPVPPREHIIYKGESKIRRGTVAVYGP